jgi:hypothetical protein
MEAKATNLRFSSKATTTARKQHSKSAVIVLLELTMYNIEDKRTLLAQILSNVNKNACEIPIATQKLRVSTTQVGSVARGFKIIQAEGIEYEKFPQSLKK